ncbi:disease resistance protein RUN1-like [Cornus florida]|uniref:disease resistance protein RUN1-like n=1 Tax=Cornus florida TaxID=4283 RepID=UPI00289FBA67|nr:disease resistance protein RUN1-like [Cornus florida]
MGKTTVAKAVFNRIYNEFETSCFLENVREKSTKDGLAKLQELLKESLKDNSISISSSDRGINLIKHRLQCKKILIVLDDEEQLQNLVGVRENWFGSGSRIIITTRNEWLLTKYGVKRCKVDLFDDNEALQLFSWHAFKLNNPVQEFRALSHRVIKYAQGLPLAFQVLRSHLCQRSKKYWVSELDDMESKLHQKIHDVLKRSFDGLDKNQKSIFLNIACFSKGYDKSIAMDYFESSKSQSECGIEALIERSLITKSKYNNLLMHDLIQEMGREIVTNNIEGILLPKVSDMHGLIPIRDLDDKFRDLYDFIGQEFDQKIVDQESKDPYLGECLPLPRSLVRLELPYGLIKQIEEPKNLKFIDLRYCTKLKKTPNLSLFPSLEALILEDCGSLIEVHPSIKFHERLAKLSFKRCQNLKSLTRSINFQSLRSLKIQGCSKLEKFPVM